MDVSLKARLTGAAPMGGSDRPVECDPFGGLITGLLGKYGEACRRGLLFHGMTAVTGVAPGTALGTTGAFTLSNPINSNVDVVVLQGQMGYVSGTLGAGVVTWNIGALPTETAPTGTLILARNGLSDGPASRVRAFTTSTIVAPTPIRVFASLGASLASSVVAPWTIKDDVDGGIILRPGGNLTLHATAAAGTSPVVVFSAAWLEIPTLG